MHIQYIGQSRLVLPHLLYTMTRKMQNPCYCTQVHTYTHTHTHTHIHTQQFFRHSNKTKGGRGGTHRPQSPSATAPTQGLTTCGSPLDPLIPQRLPLENETPPSPFAATSSEPSGCSRAFGSLLPECACIPAIRNTNQHSSIAQYSFPL